MSFVSIIIPLCNNCSTISRCIKSVVAQRIDKNTKIEIIVINDNSDDNSASIASTFDVTLINNESRKGSFAVRQQGISVAKGEFIFFLDADDWIEPYSIKKLIDESKDADIVAMPFRRRFSKLAIPTFPLPKIKTNQNISKEFAIKSILSGRNDFPLAVWGKLYRKELLIKLNIPNYPHFWGEDRYLNLFAVHYADKIKLISYVGYNYQWGGLTSGFNVNTINQYASYRYIVDNSEILSFYPHLRHLLNKEYESLLRYHIRRCITDGNMQDNDISEAILPYITTEMPPIKTIIEEEHRNVRKNFLKYLIRKML